MVCGTKTKMKISWNGALNMMESVLMVLGLMFLTVLAHEIVHYVDGYSENVAICFGFISWERSAFVINGANYTLLRGELLAYLVNLIIYVVVVVVYRKARQKKQVLE